MMPNKLARPTNDGSVPSSRPMTMWPSRFFGRSLAKVATSAAFMPGRPPALAPSAAPIGCRAPISFLISTSAAAPLATMPAWLSLTMSAASCVNTPRKAPAAPEPEFNAVSTAGVSACGGSRKPSSASRSRNLSGLSCSSRGCSARPICCASTSSVPALPGMTNPEFRRASRRVTVDKSCRRNRCSASPCAKCQMRNQDCHSAARFF